MSMVVFVTGANRGIGFAIVQLLATRIPTAAIVLGCRSNAAGQEAVEKLRLLGAGCALDVVQLDIEDDASITAAVTAVERKYGRLDVLMNNAASVSRPPSQELAAVRETSNKIFNNVVTSTALVTQAFTRLLRRSSWPRVIMTSSARGSLGMTAARELPKVALVDYCVAKAAMNMLTLHLQLAEDNREEPEGKITFWVVSPGHTKTGFNNYRGVKDPIDSAEAFVRLLESERGAIAPGTFWEFEEGVFRQVPW